jgi:hypothetical protein
MASRLLTALQGSFAVKPTSVVSRLCTCTSDPRVCSHVAHILYHAVIFAWIFCPHGSHTAKRPLLLRLSTIVRHLSMASFAFEHVPYSCPGHHDWPYVRRTRDIRSARWIAAKEQRQPIRSTEDNSGHWWIAREGMDQYQLGKLRSVQHDYLIRKVFCLDHPDEQFRLGLCAFSQSRWIRVQLVKRSIVAQNQTANSTEILQRN